jgi:hypothetical protein
MISLEQVSWIHALRRGDSAYDVCRGRKASRSINASLGCDGGGGGRSRTGSASRRRKSAREHRDVEQMPALYRGADACGLARTTGGAARRQAARHPSVDGRGCAARTGSAHRDAQGQGVHPSRTLAPYDQELVLSPQDAIRDVHPRDCGQAEWLFVLANLVRVERAPPRSTHQGAADLRASFFFPGTDSTPNMPDHGMMPYRSHIIYQVGRPPLRACQNRLSTSSSLTSSELIWITSL